MIRTSSMKLRYVREFFFATLAELYIAIRYSQSTNQGEMKNALTTSVRRSYLIVTLVPLDTLAIDHLR